METVNSGDSRDPTSPTSIFNVTVLRRFVITDIRVEEVSCFYYKLSGSDLNDHIATATLMHDRSYQS
jgi:hypothetical protein